MMAVSAAARDEESRFGRLVLVTASPSYLDHPEDGYVGGFTRQDIDDVFESLDANYVVWAESMAPVYMNTPHAPELDHEIQGSFGRISPRVARDFARVAFLSDVRHLLCRGHHPGAGPAKHRRRRHAGPRRRRTCTGRSPTAPWSGLRPRAISRKAARRRKRPPPSSNTCKPA